jgi:DNA end-binding protein Ku
VGIATMVMRNKEYLVAIRPEGDVLALETMFFADEVRSPTEELPRIPDDADLTEREVSMAQVLIDSMESEWDPARFRDTHRQKVEALIKEKSQGKVITAAKPAPTPKIVDLMEALQASISASQSTRPNPAKKATRPKVTATEKAPSKRATSSTVKKTPASKAVRRKAS